jgi:hypothetical protein
MKLSSYFRDLNSAYQAELDDLTSDSEGKDVLRRRLQDKRSEIGFLVQMIDISPEMVAVVFHQAFRFRGAAATFEPVFRLRDSFELPDWHSLASAVALEPWAEPLAETVLCQPGGEQFLTLAAALEYLQQHGQGASQSASGADSADSAEDDEDSGEDNHDDEHDEMSADDARDPQTAQSREEAGDGWLSDVGFERKS